MAPRTADSQRESNTYWNSPRRFVTSARTGSGRRFQIGPSAEPPDRIAPAKGDETPLLSERQLEVLRLVARGLSNREIAQRLHLSIRTIKRQVTDIMRTLGVSNRASAAIAAFRRGLIE